MEIENPLALHFLMQDDLFFLKKDRAMYAEQAAAVESVVAEAVAVVPTVEDLPVMAAEPEAQTSVPTFNYLGKGDKNFLILVNYPDLEFIAEAHLTALENILKRKGLAMDDVVILNMARHTEHNFETVTGHFKPEKILLLGKSSWPQGVASLNLNQPKTIGNRTALFSFSFDEMMDNNNHKKAFWDQMKTF